MDISLKYPLDHEIHTQNVRRDETAITKYSKDDGYEMTLCKVGKHGMDLIRRTKKSTDTFTKDPWISGENCKFLEYQDLPTQNKGLKKLRIRVALIAHFTEIVGERSLNKLRNETKIFSDRERFYTQKTQEHAAHCIFHHVLLNSWRKRQETLDNVQSENWILSKSVDNLTLQLKVVRLVDTNEKSKLPQSDKSVQNLKEELVLTQNESKRLKYAMDSVNEEKFSLETSINEKGRENRDLQNKLDILVTETGILELEIENTLHRRTIEESDGYDLKLEVVDLKRQARHSSPTSSNWKTQAESFETESWKLRNLIETRENCIKTNEEKRQKLRDELLGLEKEKTDLQEKVAGTSNTLDQYIKEKTTNYDKLQKIYIKLAEIEKQIQQLSASMEKQRNQNNIHRKLLYEYTLKNVRKRRFWGNTLYYVIFPLEALKGFLLGFGS